MNLESYKYGHILIKINILQCIVYRTIVWYNYIGTFNSWVEPNFKLKGGDNMNKKDFLIFSQVITILLLILLLFIVLI